MQPRFPGDSSNLNAGWTGTTHSRMQAHQRAQRALDAWPAASLFPAASIESALRQMTFVSLSEAADLRALFNFEVVS